MTGRFQPTFGLGVTCLGGEAASGRLPSRWRMPSGIQLATEDSPNVPSQNGTYRSEGRPS